MAAVDSRSPGCEWTLLAAWDHSRMARPSRAMPLARDLALRSLGDVVAKPRNPGDQSLSLQEAERLSGCLPGYPVLLGQCRDRRRRAASRQRAVLDLLTQQIG
jgi:hypothetical protein